MESCLARTRASPSSSQAAYQRRFNSDSELKVLVEQDLLLLIDIAKNIPPEVVAQLILLTFNEINIFKIIVNLSLLTQFKSHLI